MIEIPPSLIPNDLKKYFRPKRKYGPWILRNVVVWHKPNCMPSSAKDRFTVDFETIFFFTKNRKYYFEQQFEPWTDKNKHDIERALYGHKQYEGKWKNTNGKGSFALSESKIVGNPSRGRNKRCVWKIATQSFPDAHFAVFPEKLVETPIRAGCPENGVVLDPFIGSGTTAVVARKLGRNFIGIDVSKKYCEMARKRIKKVPLRLDMAI
jgi:site-specific DNA-methyltransferase (adenine-specific)